MYDISQLSLSGDKVDDEDVTKPTVFSLKNIRRYMLTFGPISSLFDFLTYGLLGIFYWHMPHQFQTGWFIESFATQVLVIYVIRTKKIPFLQSSPSRLLLFNTLLMVCLAWAMPYIKPIAKIFNFEPLPLGILFAITGFVIVYLFLVQVVKKWFYRRYPAA
jgi:Mg2+-importing ATPase